MWATARRTILINRSLGPRGAGTGSTILSGLDPATQARVKVLGIHPRINVRLQGLMIAHGRSYEGGGIFNQGNLWVITRNSSLEEGKNNNGTVTLEAGSNVYSNIACMGWFGGGGGPRAAASAAK